MTRECCWTVHVCVCARARVSAGQKLNQQPTGRREKQQSREKRGLVPSLGGQRSAPTQEASAHCSCPQAQSVSQSFKADGRAE